MASSNQIQERIDAFVRSLAEDLGEVSEADGVCWLDAIENQAVRIGDAVAGALIKNKASRRPLNDESLCPQCGKLGRYRGTRDRKLLTRRGPTTIAEPEYYCPCCRKAFFPADPSDRS